MSRAVLFDHRGHYWQQFVVPVLPKWLEVDARTFYYFDGVADSGLYSERLERMPESHTASRLNTKLHPQ